MASKRESREWSPLNELSFRSIEDRSERFRTMEEKRSVDEKETKAFEREERTREKERKRRNGGRLVFLSPPQLPTVIVRSTFLRGTVSIDRIDDAETFFPVRGYATMRRLPVVRRTIRILSK